MSILPSEQHLTSLNSQNIKKKPAAKTRKTKEKEPVRPHVKASLEDINWLRSQPPCVQQLWFDCVAVEQFGCQQRKLETSLSKNFFPKAKTALEARGLFKFERIYTTSDAGRAVATGWKVENLHGYYYKKYWELSSHDSDTSPSKRDDTAREKGQHSTKRGMTSPSKSDDISRKEGEETPETRSMTNAAENQPLLNQISTTPQPPPKGVEEGSSIPQETQQTPLGGAGATDGGMLEEKKDASTLSPASVEDQADVASDEPTNLGGGECSGGGGITTELSSDVAYTEFPFQVGSQITINWPNTEHDGKTGIVKELYWEDREVDVQLKGVLAIFCFPMARILGSGVAPSTKARFNPEHAKNRKARQGRLKCADMLGECPGAEFLAECWQDILLRPQVKALIAKHPQWGIFVDSADQLQSWFD